MFQVGTVTKENNVLKTTLFKGAPRAGIYAQARLLSPRHETRKPSLYGRSFFRRRMHNLSRLTYLSHTLPVTGRLHQSSKCFPGSGPCEDRRLWTRSRDPVSSSLHGLRIHTLVSSARGSAQEVNLELRLLHFFHFAFFLAVVTSNPQFFCNEKQYQLRQTLHLVLSCQ